MIKAMKSKPERSSNDTPWLKGTTDNKITMMIIGIMDNALDNNALSILAAMNIF